MPGENTRAPAVVSILGCGVYRLSRLSLHFVRAAVILAVFLGSSWTLSAATDSFKIISSHPADGDREVPISAAINLRLSGPVDAETLSNLTLHRFAGDNAVAVPVGRATDLTNASITLAPGDFLEANAVYEVRGSAKLHSKTGTPLKPFRFRFTTGSKRINVNEGLVFEQERFDTMRSMTTVIFGPDRRLYAADAFGHLVRWEIDEQGLPRNKTVLLDDSTMSRQYIDLEWDSGFDRRASGVVGQFRRTLGPRWGTAVFHRDDRAYGTWADDQGADRRHWTSARTRATGRLRHVAAPAEWPRIQGWQALPIGRLHVQ